jgi:hypothetical protein
MEFRTLCSCSHGMTSPGDDPGFNCPQARVTEDGLVQLRSAHDTSTVITFGPGEWEDMLAEVGATRDPLGLAALPA